MSNEAKFLDTELFDHLTRIEAILEHENLTKTASALAEQRKIVGDLYAALERLLAHVDRINPPRGPFWSGCPDQESARAALARARGEV